MGYSFKREATVGFEWSTFVCEKLKAAGIECETTPLEFAQTPEEIARFANEQDIVLPNGNCLEVKSRNLRFGTHPKSYPYETAFVDTVSGWNKKNPKPLAVVLVSQLTKSMLVISTKTSPQWTQEYRFDRVRQYPDTWYMVHKSLLKRFDELEHWLLTNTGNPAHQV